MILAIVIAVAIAAVALVGAIEVGRRAALGRSTEVELRLAAAEEPVRAFPTGATERPDVVETPARQAA